MPKLILASSLSHSPSHLFMQVQNHYKSYEGNKKEMIHAIRSVRTPCSPILFSSPPNLPSHIGRRRASAAGVRFVQARPDPDHNMDNKPNNKNQPEKSGDVMSNSFGEGYATRSDEEGFGGIYYDNQSLTKSEDKANHPEYDKSQGSEVKEKEHARNQTNASENKS